MNNKFIKRAAAVILGVCVLSTCAFAANDVTNAGYTEESTTLSFTYGSSADKVSYIAYAATQDAEGATTVGDQKYTLGDIVAVNQIDDNAGSDTVSVAIDAAKIGGATHIVIMSGDSAGDFGSSAVQVAAIPIEDFEYSETTSISETEITLNDTLYTDVPIATYTFTPNKTGKATITKLYHVLSGEKGEFKTVQNLPSNITITADSQVVVDNIYVLGAPEAAVTGGFTIEADIEFTEAQ